MTQDELEDFMLARDHGGYTDANVRGILRRYMATATTVGLDPLLVVSQMVLETGNLTSFRSQLPRRNPAGIGVTGGGRGQLLLLWDKAFRAHVGRLLAYALAEGAENPAQRALIKEALQVRAAARRPSRTRAHARRACGQLGDGQEVRGQDLRIANQIRPL